MFALYRLMLAMGLSLLTTNLFAVPLTLQQAESLALADSPVLAEIQARYDAAQQIPDQKHALPDPVLSLGIVNVPTDTWDLDQEAMTQIKVGITQAFPWPSERKLARSKALNQARATEAELQEARNGLQFRVQQSWWMLYFVDRSLAVIEDNLLRLREFNRIAQSRYRVGQGLQQDALQAQLQLSNQLDQKLRLEGQRRRLEAQLNSLMAQPDTAVIELPEVKIPADYNLPSSQMLLDLALKNRPSIQQKQRLVEAARDNQALAKKDLLPDLTLGVSYGYRQDAPNGNSRADFASLTLGIKLPLYAQSKQHRQVDQRIAEVSARKEALRAQQIKTREQIQQSLSDFRQAEEQRLLLEQGMIPQSRQTVASMLSGYQVGKVDFSALIQAQLMVNRLQLQFWKTVTDTQIALAAIENAVGTKLSQRAASLSDSESEFVTQFSSSYRLPARGTHHE